MRMAAENLKKVKILVLGDTGVGKTSLVHVICHREALSNPAWTVGCSVEVKLHDYVRSVASSNSYFLEFWDVGGSPNHKKSCSVFYQQVNGIILVHDLTNRKSHANLSKWLADYHSRGQAARTGHGFPRTGRGSSGEVRGDLDYDPEQFADQEVPILIVGTKLDQAASAKVPSSTGMTGAKCINVDCTNTVHFTPDSLQTLELNKFFDKVIEHRYFPSFHMASGYGVPHPPQGTERHRPPGRRVTQPTQ